MGLFRAPIPARTAGVRGSEAHRPPEPQELRPIYATLQQAEGSKEGLGPKAAPYRGLL